MKSFIVLSVLLFSAFSHAQGVTQNFYNCKAKVTCFGTDVYGERVVTGQKVCNVYGSGVAHTGYYAACSSESKYGESVTCTGFVKVRDAYERAVWRWKTIKETCN